MTFQAGHALPAGMIPVAGYTALFKDTEDRTHSLPVIALQAAALPGEPPVSVCIGHTGRTFLTSAPPAGLTLLAVLTTTPPSCYCAA